MQAYFQIIQIVVSLVLIGVVLMQTRGSGFSPTFSSDTSIYSSRRGMDKVLFNFTVGLAIVFVLISILSVITA